MTDIALRRQQRYTAVAIALHWIIAFAIVGMIALGWIMSDMAPGAAQLSLFQLHKSIGITILLLSVARILWRLMNPPPAEPPMAGWQRALVWLTHGGFYVLMIAMPLTGWIMASASSDFSTRYFGAFDIRLPILPDLPPDTREGIEEGVENIHSKLAWVAIGLLVLHVGGVVKHQFVDRDGALGRMAPGLFGRTAGPPDNGHGAIWAFGAAALLFAFVAGLANVSRPTTAANAEVEDAYQVPASNAPFWSVDPAQSSIVFRSAYMGQPFEGRFANWTATIQFDPVRPEDARIRVVIPTASASTGEPYFDENIGQGDWFDVARHPEAVFEVNEGVFKDSETEYEATGVLTLKGERYPVRLPFTLVIEGETAKVHGETMLSRTSLMVGRGTLTQAQGDEEWVADEVRVVIDLVATRQR